MPLNTTAFPLLLLLMVLALAIMVWLPRFLMARASRTAAAEPVAKRVPNSMDIPPAWSAEVDRLQLEMYSLSRDFKGEIDTKMCALQALIQRADETAGRLEAALERAESTGRSPTTPSSD